MLLIPLASGDACRPRLRVGDVYSVLRSVSGRPPLCTLWRVQRRPQTCQSGATSAGSSLGARGAPNRFSIVASQQREIPFELSAGRRIAATNPRLGGVASAESNISIEPAKTLGRPRGRIPSGRRPAALWRPHSQRKEPGSGRIFTLARSVRRTERFALRRLIAPKSAGGAHRS